jgi:hypothetical protein
MTAVKQKAIAASGATKGLLQQGRNAIGVKQEISDPELKPLYENLVELDELLKALRKEVVQFQESVVGMADTTSGLSEVILNFCSKDAATGTDAMRYREAVNGITAEGINHSGISIFKAELEAEVVVKIDNQLKHIADLKRRVLERELKRTENETTRQQIAFMKKEENGAQFGEDDIKDKEGVLEAGEDEFGKHNAELMADLRELKQNRFIVVNDPYQGLKRAQCRFFQSAATAISNTFMIGTGETAAAEVPPAEATSAATTVNGK